MREQGSNNIMENVSADKLATQTVQVLKRVIRRQQEQETNRLDLVGKTCFYRNLGEKEKSGVIEAIEKRQNFAGEINVRIIMDNGDVTCLGALSFPLPVEQDL